MTVMVDAAAWRKLRTGPMRSLRWLAAIGIVTGSWAATGTPKTGLAVVFPFVLAGLMLAPDIRSLTFPTPAGPATADLSPADVDTVARGAADTSKQIQENRSAMGTAPLTDSDLRSEFLPANAAPAQPQA